MGSDNGAPIKKSGHNFDMMAIAKSLGFDSELGRALSNEVGQIYKDFEDWLEEYYDEELNEIKLSFDQQQQAAKEKSITLELTSNYAYIDQSLENIVCNDLIIDFNVILILIKRIIVDLELDSLIVISQGYEVTKNNLDSFNVLFRGIYKVLANYAKKKDLNVYVYIPDLTSWLISPSSSIMIYSIVSEVILNSKVLFHELERNSLYERIASNQGKSISRVYSLNFEDFNTSLILGIMVAIKNTFKLDSVYDWFEPLNNVAGPLKDGIVKNINSTKEKDILNPTVCNMLIKEYKDWLHKRNTNPDDLKEMKTELAKLNAYNKLFRETAFRDQILDLEQSIKDYIIAVSSVSPETFFEYLNTQNFEIMCSSIEKDKAQIQKTIKDFDRIFKERIIGQDQVIKPFWDILKKWYVGIRNNKPIGSMLLCGPTGVGKTETAKLLSETTFGTLITLDMSEYQTEIDATKIIGVAPGYAGYDQGAGILDKIAANPRCIILFDEIEKAHYKIFDLLLQVLDEGRLTDHKGNIVSFSECLIICTTNAHYSELQHLGNKERGKMISILTQTFRKEFLARFNDVLKYNPLSDDTMYTIFDMKMEHELNDLSKASQVEIIIIEDENYYNVKTSLVGAMDNDLGARELGRIINQDIISKMITIIIDNNLINADKLTFYFDTEKHIHLWMDDEAKAGEGAGAGAGTNDKGKYN